MSSLGDFIVLDPQYIVQLICNHWCTGVVYFLPTVRFLKQLKDVNC